MIDAVPDRRGGGTGRRLARQSRRVDGAAVQPSGRLQVHPAGGGGQIQQETVLPQLAEQAGIKQRSGNCVENQVEPLQVSGQPSGVQARISPHRRPGQIAVPPGGHGHLCPQSLQALGQQTSDPAAAGHQAPAAVDGPVRGLYRQSDGPLRRGDGVDDRTARE